MAQQKRIKPGNLELNVEEQAIIAHYTTEVTSLEPDGQRLSTESRPGKKTITIKNLSNNDSASLAQEIVDKCKYIPATKLREVEQMVERLRQLKGGGASVLPVAADIHDVDTYMDLLYEEKNEMKVKGARHILKLALEPQYMEYLVEYDSLLSVLSRVCREEAKKSHDLACAIVGCFYCFSYYTCFHPTLAQYDCGMVTLRVLDYENRRTLVRKQEMETRRTETQKLQVEDVGEEQKQKQKEALKQQEKKFEMQQYRQNRLLQVALGTILNLCEDLQMEQKFLHKKISGGLNFVSLLVPILKRQDDEVLRMCLLVCKKISIFEENKNQLVEKGLIEQLIPLFSVTDPRTVLSALRVLYNLSFDEAVRHTVAESGLLTKLVDLLRAPPFRQYVLKLLYHFTADDKCKNLMTYHDECMGLLLHLCVGFPEPRVGRELVALVVNLTTHPRAAKQMAESPLFVQVVQRVIHTRDPILCKVVRNVMSHDGARDVLYEKLGEAGEQANDPRGHTAWIEEFIDIAQQSLDVPDLLVEILGTLVNLTGDFRTSYGEAAPEVPWLELCEGSGLIELLHRLLVGGFSEDDIILECVMLVGTIAMDQYAAPLIAASQLVKVLNELLAEKQEDDEIVLQLIFTFHCLLMCPETRDVILDESPEVVRFIMDLLMDKNSAIRTQANKTLGLIQNIDIDRSLTQGRTPQWAEKIKDLRFEEYNREWIQEMRREEQGLSPPSSKARPVSPADMSSPADRPLLRGGGAGLEWVRGAVT
jgi:hypothetical protein